MKKHIIVSVLISLVLLSGCGITKKLTEDGAGGNNSPAPSVPTDNQTTTPNPIWTTNNIVIPPQNGQVTDNGQPSQNYVFGN